MVKVKVITLFRIDVHPGTTFDPKQGRPSEPRFVHHSGDSISDPLSISTAVAPNIFRSNF